MWTAILVAANVPLGTIVQAAANGYAMICIGRVVGGVGNGMVCIHYPGHNITCSLQILPGHFHNSHLAGRVRST